MRDVLTNICTELTSDVLPLLVPTANNAASVEPGMDFFTLNAKAVEPHELHKVMFLGYLLGWSFRTLGSLALDFPTAFWNRLSGGTDFCYTLDDLEKIDI